MLFEFRKDTRSDTHDTLRCKRCNSVKVLDYKREKKVFPAAQLEACDKFLTDLMKHLDTEAALYHKRELKRMAEAGVSNDRRPLVENLSALPLFHEIEVLRQQLQSGEFPSLPNFSKRQREVMMAIDAMHTAAKTNTASAAPGVDPNEAMLLMSEEELAEVKLNETYQHLFPSHFSIYNEFLNLWSATVPVLTMLASSSKGNSSGGDGNQQSSGEDGTSSENGEEVVEQEGCPEESDFNKWSHHCSVNTCDDELLQRAMGDDTTISFVFGLEVNWSLLLAKQEETREENEMRKEQQRLDLEELNEKRRKMKERKESGKSGTGDSSGGSSGDEENQVMVTNSDKKGKKGAKEKKQKKDSKKTSGGATKEMKSPTKRTKTKPRESDVILLDDDIDVSDVDDAAGILQATQVVSQRPTRSSGQAKQDNAVSAAAPSAGATDFNWDDGNEEDEEECSGPYDFALARAARPTPPPHPKSGAAPVGSSSMKLLGAVAAPPPVLKDSQSSGFSSGTVGSGRKYELTQRKRIIDDSEDEEDERGDTDSVSALFQSTPALSLTDNLPQSKASAPVAKVKRAGRVIASDSEEDDVEIHESEVEENIRRPPLGKENKTSMRSPQPVKKNTKDNSGSSSSSSKSSSSKSSKLIIDITNTQAGPITTSGKLSQEGEEWSCVVCTFVNPFYTATCDMCDSKRVGGASKRKRSQDSV